MVGCLLHREYSRLFGLKNADHEHYWIYRDTYFPIDLGHVFRIDYKHIQDSQSHKGWPRIAHTHTQNPQVILPSDFVVGDIEVDEHGPLPGQALPSDDDDDKEASQEEGEVVAVDSQGNKRSSVKEIASADGKPPGTAGTAGGGGDDAVASNIGGGVGGGGGGSNEAGAQEVEPEDPAMGFEYDGEVIKHCADFSVSPKLVGQCVEFKCMGL